MRAVESTQCATVKKKPESIEADFPIVALEMLTQRVPQIHCDYLQPHTTNTDSKTSPLALLAATCSSIGRTESDKGKESYSKTLSPKTTSKTEDLKSSFKPYKQTPDLKFPSSSPYPPKQVSGEGAITSSSSSSPSSSSLMNSNPPYGYSFCHGGGRVPTAPSDIEKERGCVAAQNPYFDSTNNASRDIHNSVMKCHPPTQPHHHHYHHSHHHPSLSPSKQSPFGSCQDHDCTHCSTVRAANSIPLNSPNATVAAVARGGTAMCPCGLCLQMRGHPTEGSLKANSQLCQYQYSGGGGMKGAPAPPLPAPPVAPASICRDPHCTNCTVTKYPPQHHPTAGLQNYIHPALIHQCTHGSKPGQAPLPGRGMAGSPNGGLVVNDGYMKPKPPLSSQHPFVCNWVADGKHCGKSFGSSEELLQHLKSHTSPNSHQNQRQSPCASHDVPPLLPQPTAPSCNIHGCPCRLGKLSNRPMSHSGQFSGPYPSGTSGSLRYHPYGGLGPSVSSAPPSYSYLSHGMFHY